MISLILIVIINNFNPTAKERIIDRTLNQMNLLDEDKRKVREFIFFL